MNAARGVVARNAHGFAFDRGEAEPATRAEVIDVSKLSGNTIKFGAAVTLIDEDTGERRVWQIVGEPEGQYSVDGTAPSCSASLQGARRTAGPRSAFQDQGRSSCSPDPRQSRRAQL
jgi:hypothetical protein